MARVLAPFPVDLSNLPATMRGLAQAISGQTSLLPLPATDQNRAALLRTSLRAGQEIDPQVALVAATSGSTGVPKGALLSGANLVASADATHLALGGEGQWVLALPPHHIAGLQVLVRSLVAGTVPLVLDVESGFDVAAFAAVSAAATAQAAAVAAPLYTALVPLQLDKCLQSVAGVNALRRYDAILLGGAPTPPALLERALALNIAVVRTYGSAETAGGCVYEGFALPGVSLKLVDCGGSTPGMDPTGRLWISGPMVAQGYRNPLPAAEDPFATAGWYRTSDSAALVAADLAASPALAQLPSEFPLFGQPATQLKQLIIKGRADAVIISGGLKLQPEILEAQLLSHPDISAACVVGLPNERLGQAIAAAYTGTATPTEVLAHLADHPAVPSWTIPRQLKRVAVLPTTGPGKIDRRAVLELFSP